MRLLVLAGSVCLCLLPLTAVRAAAPPARMSPGQKQQFDRARALLVRGTNHFDQGKFDLAEADLRAGLDLERRLLGAVSARSLESLERLARLAQMRDRYADAIALRAELLALAGRYWGPTNWRTVSPRLELADARQHARMSPEQRRRLLTAGEWTFEARRLAEKRQYREAVEKQRQALAVFREMLGKDHHVCADVLTRLGEYLRRAGQPGEAVRALREELAIRRATLGEIHPLTATAANDLAAALMSLGQFTEARRLFVDVVRVREQVWGPQSRSVALGLNNLAQVCRELGDPAHARPLLERACAIAAAGELTPAQHAVLLVNLAAVLHDLADYAAALPLYEQALKLRPNDADNARLYNNLANLHNRLGDNARARQLMARSLRIRLEAHGDKHPTYALGLSNLAQLYQRAGDLHRALTLAEQAHAIRVAAWGDDHPETATSLNNLAALYGQAGRHEKAIQLAQRAVETRRRLLGERHPLYGLSLGNLANQLQDVGRKGEAYRFSRQGMEVHRRHLDDCFAVLSERQRLDLLAQLRDSLDYHTTYALAAGADAAALYDAVLAWKGLLLARQAEERLAIDQRELAPLLAQLAQVRGAMARLAARPPEPATVRAWQASFAKMEKARERLEVDLARRSAEFRRLIKGRTDLAAQTAAAVPAGAVLVDFFEYSHPLPPRRRGAAPQRQRRLLAFVVPAGGKVTVIELGSVAPIGEAVAAWRRPLQAVPPGPVDERAGARLRQLLWQPLGAAVRDARVVLVAPDGIVAGLPLAALPGGKPGTYLLEEKTLGLLTSGRQLLEPARGAASGGLFVLGGLDYGPIRHKGGGRRSADVPALPGTRLEAARVATLYAAAFPKGKAARLLDGDRGGRAIVLRELGGHRYVHLATHGYFEPPDADAALRRNPLLSSGLLLAGANRDRAAGLLTAEEVRGVDLRGCELVVLSACETGLGKLVAGEGVLGLQRAFHLAGAQAVMTSLWSVSDPATSVLMERFYLNLWGKERLSKLEALRQAQLFVLRNPQAVAERAVQLRKVAGVKAALRGVGKDEVDLPTGKGEGRSHPAWWAAFVLSGAGG